MQPTVTMFDPSGIPHVLVYVGISSHATLDTTDERTDDMGTTETAGEYHCSYCLSSHSADCCPLRQMEKRYEATGIPSCGSLAPLHHHGCQCYICMVAARHFLAARDYLRGKGPAETHTHVGAMGRVVLERGDSSGVFTALRPDTGDHYIAYAWSEVIAWAQDNR